MVASDKSHPALAFAERLNRALLEKGKKPSPTALAREFNLRWRGVPVTVNATRKWLKGQAVPTLDKISVLSGLLGVSNDWLRWGEATMTYRESGKPTSNMKSYVQDAVSQDSSSAFQDYNLLNPTNRRLVEAVIETLLKEQTQRKNSRNGA